MIKRKIYYLWTLTPKKNLGRGGLEVRSRLRGRRLPGLKTDSTEDPPCMRPVVSYVVAKRSSAGVVQKFGEEVPAQVSSSSSDRGSKLRGLSQNSSRVASKRDVNITKLIHKSSRIQNYSNIVFFPPAGELQYLLVLLTRETFFNP
ncbi:hypothetical protein AVEN_240257-1 [Araneus ventricosus]|uniref:Uncharacterized protein n=1 Tax=Araneus ventricosus TaxID=182803 RepID=A0A4Y2WQC6_ARAVE|nr:hypothetical protein AVEN_240257-1 [Araneus ventricosus]